MRYTSLPIWLAWSVFSLLNDLRNQGQCSPFYLILLNKVWTPGETTSAGRHQHGGQPRPLSSAYFRAVRNYLFRRSKKHSRCWWKVYCCCWIRHLPRRSAPNTPSPTTSTTTKCILLQRFFRERGNGRRFYGCCWQRLWITSTSTFSAER